ncbi:MAG: diguanylate cyclase [Deltaproteobacteria bacterium]|nr:diguanylate cyclase [Deltaproteobacteria bacterium]MBW2660453.1 diguanylate cyclase [Deltaproteobacteria bacterium]
MKSIVIISKDIRTLNVLERMLKGLYKTAVFNNIQSALDYIYDSIPDLVIIDINTDDLASINILSNLKEDPIFYQLPVLAVFSDQPAVATWDSLSVEDYICKSNLEKDMLIRVKLSIIRAERVVEINPLTKLPGNVSINKQIQKRLDKKEAFALAYADLDYFKPLNDKYGFSRGDEVIRITGRLILNIVKNKQPENSFVGHIGGDDLIFIMDSNLVEKTSQAIIDTFDSIIPSFYDSADIARGYLESRDRQGHLKSFDVMSISIGITNTKSGNFSHYGEITERASEMKKYAKRFKGSCYRLDMR